MGVRKKKGVFKNCIECNEIFYITPGLVGSLDIKHPEPKYCSNRCRLLNPLFKNTGRTRFQSRERSFKGTQKEYYQLHHWVRKNKGKAFWCTFCFSCKKVEWANISGLYRKELNDYMQLCNKCHFKYDKHDLRLGFINQEKMTTRYDREEI